MIQFFLKKWHWI